MPTFTAPEWLILIPALLLLGWFWKTSGLLLFRRVVIVSLVALLLADPRVIRTQDSLDLYVLFDRSASTEDLVDQSSTGWIDLLEDSKPGRSDTLHLINYAAEVSPQTGPETTVYTGSRQLTRTALALQTALGSRAEDKPARILLFTDGFATEPLGDLVEKLGETGVPLDYRLVREDASGDFRLASLQIPNRTQQGEPFVISVRVRGKEDATVPLEILREGKLLTRTEVEVKDSVGKIEFTDRLARPGAYEYTARISPKGDVHQGNNQAEQWIEVTGGPRIVLLTNYENDPLATALTAQGFTVDVLDRPEVARPGQLAGARAVIINNVGASQLPDTFLDAVNFLVREQGAGLAMIGGKRSFGAGGYHDSAIDELLPVSMELKHEHRKLRVAMAIVMDRSGSMAATVGGGGGRQMTKMELAANGAANAIELLGNQDFVSVIPVDSEPHVVIPMSQVGGEKNSLMKKARQIRSSGGGIYVYTGLSAAWKELQKTDVGTKHIILFSDAADTEEPGRYRELLAEMKAADCTVSVIGLGTKTDIDADLLEEIATLGDGRIFFTDRPQEVPRIFAQETVAIARSAFLKDPVNGSPTGSWTEVSADDIQWPGTFDGYNLSYLRSDATMDLVSEDSYRAPLVAHARRGLGRSLAVSFPLGGDHSQRVRNWGGYADFAQTFSRWLMGTETPPGLSLRHHVQGTELKLDLLYDITEWGDKLAESPPIVKLLLGGESTAQEAVWQRLAPGHFSLSQTLPEGSTLRGVAQVGNYTLPFGPLTIGGNAEWQFENDRITELKVASAQSGGRELLDLSKAWVRPPVREERDLRIPLAALLILAILLDAFVTRTGWSFGKRLTVTRESVVKEAKARPAASPKPQPARQAPKLESESTPQSEEKAPPSSQQSRFNRAKNRR